MITTSILGTTYSIELSDLNNREVATRDGVTYRYDKKIVVRDPEYLSFHASEKAKAEIARHVILHELIHAYGMESHVNYDEDEDLVDWIAGIIPSIVASYDDILRQLQEQESDRGNK